MSEKNNTFKADLDIRTVWYIKYLFPLVGETLQTIAGNAFYCDYNQKEWEDLQLSMIGSDLFNGVVEDQTLIETDISFKA